ncbi:rod shape-determining protein RodA [Wolbachia endosymbiont of Atemnus politus]|uniref:rod shape-determining protein RodA n=1 Tax=Wolbachia endosymbiont of Atemnus politus TaxID=2682840 RepID=UPI001574D418|nr:rod shape-determining protein RodA [Wolbachia endosymbiont of Atemnus politus]NSM56239.1 rod shape-determining protein RodA [Wolbachia endosymbiont of Atemnus politus]NSX83463.1 rod shape-determining protein RodA [Wolbachia endosymbiont of Atemnus politus]
MHFESFFSVDKLKKIHWLLVVNVIALFCVGIVVQYSSAGGKWMPFAIHQLAVFSFFFLLAVAMSFIEIDFYLEHAYFFYIAAVISLLVVNFFGLHIMGATRWIRIGSISLQPSEFAKVGLILALACYFNKQSVYKMMEFQKLFKGFVIIFLPVFLVLKQPNLGTAVIMLFIGASIIFASIIKRSHLIVFGTLGVLAIPAIWSFLRPYHKQRILSFLDSSVDPLGIGYNAQQSQIAIGSGGLLGKGFVNGSQTQLGFLPEKRTDFAFAVLGEEWGFLGSMALILLYTTLLAIIFSIAYRSKNYFSKLVSIGIFAFFGAHFFINIGMTIGLLPVIGDPLPFLSYGGSTTAASLICIGLLLSCVTSEEDLRLSSRFYPQEGL